jgi:hypothetical protein
MSEGCVKKMPYSLHVRGMCKHLAYISCYRSGKGITMLFFQGHIIEDDWGVAT